MNLHLASLTPFANGSGGGDQMLNVNNGTIRLIRAGGQGGQMLNVNNGTIMVNVKCKQRHRSDLNVNNGTVRRDTVQLQRGERNANERERTS